MGQGQVIF